MTDPVPLRIVQPSRGTELAVSGGYHGEEV
jgi:hypothetical protein